jgi:hypothetical protein
LVVILLVLFVIFLGVVCLFRRRTKVKSIDDLLLLVGEKLVLVDAVSEGNREQRARYIVRKLTSRLKIYVTLWQIVSIMPFALDLRFPDVYTDILSTLHAMNIDVSRSSLVTCSTGKEYDGIDGLILATVYPLVIVGLIWVAHLVHLSVIKTRSMASDAVVKANYHKAFLLFTYLILPSTSAKIFEVFSCRNVDPDDVSDGDDVYMVMDYSVSCSSQKYHSGFIWAIVSIIVYPIGIPCYYFFVLYTAREDIKGRDCTAVAQEAESESEAKAMRLQRLQSIRLLFETYEPKFWYWEVIDTFKRLMLTGVLVLIAQGSAVQIVVGMCLSLLFLKLYDISRPHADQAIYAIETVSQWQVFFIFFLALLLKADFGSVQTAALDVLFVLAVFTNVIIDLCKFTFWAFTKHSRHQGKWDTRSFEMSDRSGEEVSNKALPAPLPGISEEDIEKGDTDDNAHLQSSGVDDVDVDNATMEKALTQFQALQPPDTTKVEDAFNTSLLATNHQHESMVVESPLFDSSSREK